LIALRKVAAKCGNESGENGKFTSDISAIEVVSWVRFLFSRISEA
jgi:hypothetical protein